MMLYRSGMNGRVALVQVMAFPNRQKGIGEQEMEEARNAV
jgi:hypothetical protein